MPKKRRGKKPAPAPQRRRVGEPSPSFLEALQAQRARQAASRSDASPTEPRTQPTASNAPRLPGLVYDPVTKRHWPAGSVPRGAGGDTPPRPTLPRATACSLATLTRRRALGQVPAVGMVSRCRAAVMCALKPVTWPGVRSLCAADVSSHNGMLAAAQVDGTVTLGPPTPDHGVLSCVDRPPSAGACVRLQWWPARANVLLEARSGGPGAAGSIQVDDVTVCMPSATSMQDDDSVFHAAWLPHDFAVAVATSSRVVRIDAMRGRPTSAWAPASDVLHVTPGGDERVWWGCRDGGFGAADVRMAHPKPKPCGKLPSSIVALHVGADGRHVLAADADSTATLYDTRRMGSGVVSYPRYLNSYKRVPVAVDPAFRTLFACAPHSTAVSCWDIATGACVASVDTGGGAAHLSALAVFEGGGGGTPPGPGLLFGSRAWMRVACSRAPYTPPSGACGVGGWV